MGRDRLRTARGASRRVWDEKKAGRGLRPSVRLRLISWLCRAMVGWYRAIDRRLDAWGFEPIDPTSLEDIRSELESIEPDVSLGPIMTPADAPRLFEMLEKLSRKMKSRVPAEVRMSHLPVCGIVEAGPVWSPRRPVLVIGLPCLHVWGIDELRAVLAHELAHVRFQDAEFNREVLLPLDVLKRRLSAQSGPAASGLRRRLAQFFLRWTDWFAQPVSRWIEFRADHCSARTCGSAALGSAIEKMAVVQPIFREILSYTDVQTAKNVYRIFAKAWSNLMNGEKYEQLRKLFLNRPLDGETAHHPPVSTRLNRIRSFQPGRNRVFPSLHLLDRPETIERLLHNHLFQDHQDSESVFHPSR